MTERPTTRGAQTAAFECCGLTRTDAVEDTLKAIFELTGQGGILGTSRIAQHLGVTPPTTSAMLKRLLAHGLLERAVAGDLRLTDHGEAHARELVRRQRILETFLVEMLHLPWDEVYEESELLEHAVSDRVLRRIDELLGHPNLDPHGDPIPQPRAEHVETWGLALDDGLPIGCNFLVERVRSEDPAALRYLASLGIWPGVTVEVVDQAPFEGPLYVLVDGDTHALGAPLTNLVHGRLVKAGDDAASS